MKHKVVTATENLLLSYQLCKHLILVTTEIRALRPESYLGSL